MKKPEDLPPYQLEDDTERAVVRAVCSQPRFYSRLGSELEPERMSSSSAKLLVAGAHAITKKRGDSPEWPGTVMQHLADLRDDGKLTYEQVEAARDFLFEAEQLPLIPADELVDAVAPTIRRVLHKEAVVAALDGYKNKHDPTHTAVVFDRVARVGKASEHVAIGLGAELEFFEKVEKKDVLPFGVPEIDSAIDGGLECPALGIVVGETGVGKSMALAHIAVEALLAGRDVLYVTLELSAQVTKRRIIRNLIDMEDRECGEFPEEALRRLKAVMAEPGFGRFVVQYADPLLTSPRMISAMLKDARRDHPGFNPRVCVTDFMDKLRVDGRKSLYEDQLAVADGLRAIAVEINGWSWTASQATRKATSRPWLDLDAIADSMNKVRSADLVVAIGRSEEDKQSDQIRYTIPKRREGEGAYSRVGPITWDPEHGRICVVSRPVPW